MLAAANADATGVNSYALQASVPEFLKLARSETSSFALTVTCFVLFISRKPSYPAISSSSLRAESSLDGEATFSFELTSAVSPLTTVTFTATDPPSQDTSSAEIRKCSVNSPSNPGGPKTKSSTVPVWPGATDDSINVPTW